MDIVLNLYELYGNGDYIGEKISQIEHALQSAFLAEKKRPYDNEFIIAALLHDVGHIIPSSDISNFGKMDNLGITNHEEVGANYLMELGFTNRIVYLVANHVKAKRYLATLDHIYLEQLSDASQSTLIYQGGLMSENEITDFKSNPWSIDAILLRNIEDSAKQIDGPTKPLEYYKNIICNLYKN